MLARGMRSDEFADRALAALAGPGFEAYDGLDLPDLDRHRRALFELVQATIESGAPPELAERLVEELAANLELQTTRARFYDGVSGARPETAPEFERTWSALDARSNGVGAVHLELGAWTAFPDERARQLAESDGLAEFIRLDFEPTYELDVVGDAQALPFADESIDRIRADSLLEHVAYPHDVLRECFRVLRPGGCAFFITPWVFNLHGYPDDYLRYSPSWYERVGRETGFAEVGAFSDLASGLYYTLHNSAKTAIAEEERDGAAAARMLHVLALELLGALVPLDRRFRAQARHWFVAVQCYALKPGDYVPSGRACSPERAFVERAVDLLACPHSKKPLLLEADSLLCDASRLRYPLRDGIPLFTQARELRRPTTLKLVREGRRIAAMLSR
jgi:SAM-dependent methyltransferase/uncharacterized protein YbaR (Trm112 family)